MGGENLFSACEVRLVKKVNPSKISLGRVCWILYACIDLVAVVFRVTSIS